MTSAIKAVRFALHFVKAGAYLAEKNYLSARGQMDLARRLVSSRLGESKFFDFHLRAAMIEIYLDKDAALKHLSIAYKQICEYKRLSTLDQNYLLDYCGLLLVK